MPINEFFAPYDQTEEKDLLMDLNCECIEAMGHKMYYLPRTQENLDKLFGEATVSSYYNAVEIEVYLGAAGVSTPSFITKAGGVPEIRESQTFIISRQTFSDRFCGDIGGDHPLEKLQRPREGDMIYFGMDDGMIFEVRYVNDESPFYQVGGQYVWELKVEAMEYSNEKIRTDIPEIDAIEDRYVSAVDIVYDSASGFAHNDVVYQGDNLSEATFRADVLSFDEETKTIRLKHLLGTFNPSLDLETEGGGVASDVVSSTLEDGSNSTNDPLSDNKQIQEEGSTLVDFDPLNPFKFAE